MKKWYPSWTKKNQYILGKIIPNYQKAVMTQKTWRKEQMTDDLWACTMIQK